MAKNLVFSGTLLQMADPASSLSYGELPPAPPAARQEQDFFGKLFGRNLGGVLASIVLAFVTMLVFYRLQMFGPTSAINRFNQATAKWDTQEMATVTVQRGLNESEFQVLTLAHNLSLKASSIQIVNLQQAGDEAIARVVYEMPNGTSAVMLYVLTERHGIWKIDLQQSVTALLRALG